MVSPEKMLVEVGDQAAWKVHDALLLCTESDFQGVTKLAMEVRQHLCQIPPKITDNCVRIMYLLAGGAFVMERCFAKVQVLTVRVRMENSLLRAAGVSESER